MLTRFLKRASRSLVTHVAGHYPIRQLSLAIVNHCRVVQTGLWHRRYATVPFGEQGAIPACAILSNGLSTVLWV